MEGIIINIPAHRLPLRDYQKEFLMNIRKVRQAVLCWSRRGAKTYTVFVEHIVARMVEETMNVVIVYPTAKQGFKNFWTNIENDGFKTLDHIPKELIAAQSNSEDDMRITLVNGSTLFVMGATKAAALRGANAKIYFFDEFVDIPSGALGVVRPITNMNGGQIIITSTPKQDGISGGTFKRLYESAVKRDDQYASFVRGDRFMTKEQMETLRQDYIDEYESDFLYKQEILLDWGQSSLTSYYGDVLSKISKDGRLGDHAYDARRPVYTSWDLGGGAGTTAILFWQYYDKELHIIDQHETHDIGDEAIVKFVQSKPYNYGWHFWPHDGARADSDIISRIAKVRAYGLINTSLLIRKGKEPGINRVISLLSRPTTTIHAPTCTGTVEKWKRYLRKFNEFTGDYEGPEHKTESHISDALRYCAEAIDQAFDPLTGLTYMVQVAQTSTVDENEDWNALADSNW
jgi:hypothetical protein